MEDLIVTTGDMALPPTSLILHCQNNQTQPSLILESSLDSVTKLEVSGCFFTNCLSS